MKLIKKEFLFFIFLFLFLVFITVYPKEINYIYDYIGWSTIRALSVLLLLTTALKLSNIFDYISAKFVTFLHTEKTLALFFVMLSMFLSMFLTNDITLFVVVPITISLKHIIKNDITKLVIFEAIAVNVGSLLTPIGNPQNLFLFREWGVGFYDFLRIMSPVFVISAVLLFLFTLTVFPKKPLEITDIKTPKPDKFLFFTTIVFFIVFIFALEMHFVKILIPAVIMWFLIIKKEVFLKFDYFLIFTFILMFIDFNIISNIDFVKNIISSINLNSLNVFNLSVAASQFMSNVPAAIFVSKFSHDYQAIAYGVNVAGNGFIIASLANIIALRFLNSSKAYVDFHKYSIPYFILSYLLVIVILG